MNTQSDYRRRFVASSLLLPVPLLLLAEVVLAHSIVTGGSFVVAAPSMLLVGAATWAAYPTIARTETWGRRFLLYLALGMGIIVASSVLSHALLSVFRSRHLQWPNVPFFVTLFGVPCTLAAYAMHFIFRSYFFAS
jgi:hypothetical protein